MIDPLLEQMLRIRTIEIEISKRYAEQKMRTPIHLSVGQEAAAVGVCSALGPDDLVVSTHRSHAHYLAKGGDLNAFIAELHGKSTGCSGGMGGSMHLVDRSCGFMGSTSIVAGTIPIGVGMALKKQMKKEPGRVVIFHGDAAVEEGVWHESVNFALLKKLPVLFVCENNGFSCYTPLSERQPRVYFRDLVQGHGMPYLWCGGLVREIKKATEQVLRIDGPSFLEIHCSRWFEHCGPKAESLGVDEISHLDGSKYFEEINQAFEKAEQAPWPKPMDLYAY